jgi:signal peptidase I
MRLSGAGIDCAATKCELAAEVLAAHGRLRLQVNGWSMFPAIRPGDTLIVDRADHASIVAGEVVLFRRRQRFFVHRAIAPTATQSSALLTRGDAMPQADPPVHEQELIGRVSSLLRRGRYVALSRNPSLRERTLSALFWRSKACARVMARMHAMHQV